MPPVEDMPSKVTDKLPEKTEPKVENTTSKPKAAPKQKPVVKINKELEEVVKKIDALRAQGITNCAFRVALIEAPGVKDALIAKNYTVDRGEDPLNYQVGFGT